MSAAGWLRFEVKYMLYVLVRSNNSSRHFLFRGDSFIEDLRFDLGIVRDASFEKRTLSPPVLQNLKFQVLRTKKTKNTENVPNNVFKYVV